MALINERIAALRRQRGLTQEQLGVLVGVSAQAVSKWEKGGAPDVELLPRLADTLGVTIDALFGRSDQPAEDIQTALQRWLNAQPSDKRLWTLFHLLSKTVWSSMSEDMSPIFSGMLGSAFYQKDCFLTVPGKGTQWLRSKAVTDEGMSLGVFADQLPLYLLMPEPEAGYASELLPLEQYRPLFTALSKPGALEILCYFARKKDYAYATASGIARNLGLSCQQADDILRDLAQINLLHHLNLETQEGEISAYRLNGQNALIPFLVFARWLLEKDEAWIYCLDLRERSILKRRENQNEANP